MRKAYAVRPMGGAKLGAIVLILAFLLALTGCQDGSGSVGLIIPSGSLARLESEEVASSLDIVGLIGELGNPPAGMDVRWIEETISGGSETPQHATIKAIVTFSGRYSGAGISGSAIKWITSGTVTIEFTGTATDDGSNQAVDLTAYSAKADGLKLVQTNGTRSNTYNVTATGITGSVDIDMTYPISQGATEIADPSVTVGETITVNSGATISVDDEDIILVSPWTGSADTSWYSDAETEFLITTPEQLAGISELVNGGEDFKGKTLKLTNDLDMNNHPWTSIGSESTLFNGIFDGQGHTISNVNVTTGLSESYYGFFAKLASDAVVKNVTIEGNVNPAAGSTVYAGGIAGLNSGEIIDSNFSGNVNGITVAGNSLYSFTGGIAGKNTGSITSCDFSGNVNGITSAAKIMSTSTTGGISGDNSGNIADCNFSGSISGITGTAYVYSETVGGISGKNTGTIKGCSSSGSVSGEKATSDDSGGIVGTNDGVIIGCDSLSEVNGGYAGGIASTNKGSIIACYSSKTIKGGNNAAGGIVGSNMSGSSVIACYSTATVTGNSKAGTIIGLNKGIVTSCYWSGDSDKGVDTDNTGSAEAEKVENGDWSSAMASMNGAIETWNGSNDNACIYKYTAVGFSPEDGVPLILINQN